jgi:fatty acid desaturase
MHARLSRLEPARWLGAAITDWAIIALTLLVVAQIDHPVAYVLAVIPLGSRQQALGALFHDAAHQLVTRRRIVNDVLGSLLAAWPLGLTLGGYRRYHFAHHRALGSADDPENHHKGLLRQWSLPARPGRVLAGFVGDLFGGGLPHLLAAGKLTRPVSVAEACGMLLFWAAIVSACVWLGAWWIPIVWVASIATVFWSGVRLRIWTEHLGTSSTHRISVPEWLEQLIMPHDIGLHWEHHRYPSVPFYNLAALRVRVEGPPIVSLVALARGFLASAPLPSGQVADTVHAAPISSVPDPRHTTRRAVALVLVPLLAGVLVYALLRPPGIVLDDWLARLGLFVPRLQFSAGWLAPIFAWLPSALWTFALTAFVGGLWPPTLARPRRVWLAVVAVVVFGWELGQVLGCWPGCFSLADLLASVVAFSAALRYTSKGRWENP